MTESGRTWFVVDDQLNDVESFCASFRMESEGRPYAWAALKPSEATARLLQPSKMPIAGVLVDIDLSSDPDVAGTGLGFAQDLRAKQKNGEIPDYPIVRFANPDPVKRYVGADPVSDDLFDLLVGKDHARNFPKIVVEECSAIREVYDRLEPRNFNETKFAELCGLTSDRFELWADVRFYQRVSTGLAAALHVGAGAFIRHFLMPDGLLIGERLLAVRMGVDIEASGAAWSALKSELASVSYTGLGSVGFERWWARGIEAFWFTLDPESYLHELTVSERVAKLTKRLSLGGLAPVRGFVESPGDRYWRLCTLSKEAGQIVPVDPRRAVSMTPLVPTDPWVEPEQAALGVALMVRDLDSRLSKIDLKRWSR